jgi:hypothetical protein
MITSTLERDTDHVMKVLSMMHPITMQLTMQLSQMMVMMTMTMK